MTDLTIATLANDYFQSDPPWAPRAYELLGRLVFLWGQVDVRLRALVDLTEIATHSPNRSIIGMTTSLDRLERFCRADQGRKLASDLLPLVSQARSFAPHRNVLQHGAIFHVGGCEEEFTLLLFSDRAAPPSPLIGWQQLEYSESALLALVDGIGGLGADLAVLLQRHHPNATTDLTNRTVLNAGT